MVTPLPSQSKSLADELACGRDVDEDVVCSPGGSGSEAASCAGLRCASARRWTVIEELRRHCCKWRMSSRPPFPLSAAMSMEMAMQKRPREKVASCLLPPGER